jgi:4-amino-4-deoxy-L-arabinose transferase-like glycosyltransferase
LCAWRRFAPLGGPLLFIAVVGGWMALASTDEAYSLAEALRVHVLERAARGLHHAQPPWYYLEVLPVKLLPWSLAALAALWLAWKERCRAWARFCLAWAGFVVLFFSIWTEKRDLYVLPAFPAFALMIAALAERLTARPLAGALSPRGFRAAQALTGALMTLAGVAVPLVAAKMALLEGAALWAPAAALFGGGAALLWVAWKRSAGGTAWTTAAATALVYLSIAAFLLPALEPRTSARPFAQAVRRLTADGRGAGGRVYSYGLGNLTDALNFYSEGVYVRRVKGVDEVFAALKDDPSSYALADRSRLPEPGRPGSPPLRILYSAEVGGKEIVLLGSGVNLR